MIKLAGGEEAWALLSPDQRRDLSATMIKQVLISLGESEYSSLTEEQRKELDFFVWVGCGCHKNTNTVLGGHAAVMKWWGENDLPGPVLLANKDNTAVLRTLDPDAEPTAAYEHALQSSTRGGIKATDIAGGIKIIRKANSILLSCGLNSLVIHLLSLAHPTIAMAHTVLQLHVFCCILTSSSNFWSLSEIKRRLAPLTTWRIIFTMH
jgi:hypothetical protein